MMPSLMKRFMAVAALVVACGAAPFAQRSGQPVPAPALPAPGGAAPDAPGISPAEIQRLFDAYALLQTQDQLRIAGDQSLQFLARFRDLQDIRRKSLVERTRRINAMRQTLNGETPPDEAALREQLKAIQDLDARTAADMKRAYDAIDQVLDVRQQAKFRVFEENMERRKLDLVTRARQANQANRGRQ